MEMHDEIEDAARVEPGHPGAKQPGVMIAEAMVPEPVIQQPGSGNAQKQGHELDKPEAGHHQKRHPEQFRSGLNERVHQR